MFLSRDPNLMVLSEHISRQVELFLRDGGQIERLPDYNAVTGNTTAGRRMPLMRRVAGAQADEAASLPAAGGGRTLK